MNQPSFPCSPEDQRDKEKWALFFDGQAHDAETPRWTRGYYHERVRNLVQSLVPVGARVLELGCGQGHLLAALKPSFGVGIDQSSKMIEEAKKNHPDLTFNIQDAENLKNEVIPGPFDYIVLSDLVGSVVDVWKCFQGLGPLCTPETRIVLTYYNYLWEPALWLAECLSLRKKQPKQNWLPIQEVENLLSLAGFESFRRGTATLFPIKIPIISWFVNRFLAPLPIFYHLCMSLYVVARPRKAMAVEPFTVSVVVPCRNEKANIRPLIERTPSMGLRTEIIFVDGNSSDGTVEEIKEVLNNYTGSKSIHLIHQENASGKADAVHKGFATATGDILMILDADLTVVPEDLPKFYLALAQGQAEFINGTRLVYPTDEKAFRPLNLLGNKFFAQLVSWLLGQRVRDTLCGTKVFFRKDYSRIMSIREKVGRIDPFGDFELLFGASNANLKITEIPIRYRERTYGETKISRFKDGWKLLKMCALAAQRLKFSIYP